jgi:3-deoxy-manno-octulosonate cytidylyltransferase (CMP-KDO synthetase)
MPQAVVIIPARFASTRFPGKVLASLLGRPLIAHVIDGVRGARLVSRILVAVDDDRVAEAAAAAGAEIVRTRSDHPSGTDRVAEAARGLDAECIINVQGDEPLIRPETVDFLAGALLQSAGDDLATLSESLDDPRDILDPNVVKVVTDRDGRALYFSRSPIPYRRGTGDILPRELSPAHLGKNAGGYHRHVGLYAYRREVLLDLAGTPPTPLETSEGLEQLRALETGRRIRVLPTTFPMVGVDTPDDLARVESLMKASPT